MKRCPMTFEILLEYCEGALKATTKERVRRHLETGCVYCERQLAWIQRVLSAFQRENPPIPAHVLAPARTLYLDRYVRPESSSPLVQWARLLFDSRTQYTPAFARGEQEPSRHQIYRTDGYEIEIWQEMLPQGECYLIGQVLPRRDHANVIPKEIILSNSAGHTLRITPVASEFHLPSVPAGHYQVQVSLPGVDIRLSEVAVGL
ncbi:MAG TPA: hypothetical protein VFA07_19445 [Chthonomonadaceae bacterium]|nr:hypothetical protein [Chthonomonadaceae bacterium]